MEPHEVTQPDATVRTMTADKWGRVRIRPLQAGRYTVESGGVTTQVLANYYDAAESDLGAKPQAEASAPAERAAALESAIRQTSAATRFHFDCAGVARA